MSVTLDIDTREIDALRRRLRAAIGQVTSAKGRRAVNEAMLPHLQAHVQRMFDTQGAAGRHGAWPRYQRNERRYRIVKRKLTGSDTPLLGWGRGRSELIASLTHRSHPQAIVRTMGDLVFGSRHEAADGRELLPKWARMRGRSPVPPRRRVVDLTPKDERKIMQAALDVIEGMINVF